MSRAPGSRQYLAYGLCLASDLPIPELASTADPSRSPDLCITFEDGGRPPSDGLRWVFESEDESGRPWLRCARSEHGYLIRYPDLADFSIDVHGREISCHAAAPDVSDEAVRHLVLNQVLPLTFKLRGMEALHASTVLTPGGVCAFIGPTGSGKSTMAARLLRAGYPTLSDDCMVVSADAGIEVVPGYPGVRLRDDSFSLVAEGASETGNGGGAKRHWLPARGIEGFAAHRQPLRRIYRLMRRVAGASPRHGAGDGPLEAVTARDAVIELVDHTFRLDRTDRGMLTREFQILEQVARSVPMRRLWLDGDLGSSEPCEAVLRDVGPDAD